MKNGTFEYQMPTLFAQTLLDERKGEEKKMNPQEYLIKYVNEQCGLLGICTAVVLN